jgi:hypothetical protein
MYQFVLDSYISYSLATVAVLFVSWIAIECWAHSSNEISS